MPLKRLPEVPRFAPEIPEPEIKDSWNPIYVFGDWHTEGFIPVGNPKKVSLHVPKCYSAPEQPYVNPEQSLAEHAAGFGPTKLVFKKPKTQHVWDGEKVIESAALAARMAKAKAEFEKSLNDELEDYLFRDEDGLPDKECCPPAPSTANLDF